MPRQRRPGSQRRQLLDVTCEAVTFRYLKDGEGKPAEAADGKDKGKGKPKVIKEVTEERGFFRRGVPGR